MLRDLAYQENMLINIYTLMAELPKYMKKKNLQN
jgi:hypothetical protein